MCTQQVEKIALKANRVRGFYIATLNTVLRILKTDVTKYLFSQYIGVAMHRLYGPLTIINM